MAFIAIDWGSAYQRNCAMRIDNQSSVDALVMRWPPSLLGTCLANLFWEAAPIGHAHGEYVDAKSNVVDPPAHRRDATRRGSRISTEWHATRNPSRSPIDAVPFVGAQLYFNNDKHWAYNEVPNWLIGGVSVYVSPSPWETGDLPSLVATSMGPPPPISPTDARFFTFARLLAVTPYRLE